MFFVLILKPVYYSSESLGLEVFISLLITFYKCAAFICALSNNA